MKAKNKSKNANSEEEYKDFFVRTEVFENDGAKIVRVQESESSDENDEVVQMTDEQLFAACNGRTAHKYVIFLFYLPTTNSINMV